MEPRLSTLCHDLKTERPDIGRPLPGILRIVPIGFGFSLLATISLSALLFWQFRQARDARDHWRSEEEAQKATAARVAKETEEINAEKKRAEDVRKWVAGSSSVQEIVLTVLRSMGATGSLSELSLIRDKDDPKKIDFSMLVTNGGNPQLAATIGKLSGDLNYRPLFPNTLPIKGGGVDYRATLLKSERAADLPDTLRSAVPAAVSPAAAGASATPAAAPAPAAPPTVGSTTPAQ